MATNETPNTPEVVENALSKSEQFIENNQKSLTVIVIAVLAIVAIYFGYKNWYIAPMEEEAQSQIFNAEYHFERDSFRLALNGTENDLGFLEIAKQYGPSRTGNLANYYCGICYRQLGEFETAIQYLKKFDANDKVLTPVAYGAIGDCYVELQQLSEAAQYYEKAASYEKNDFTTPLFLKKAGQVYAALGNHAKALKLYESIKTDYIRSTEGRDIEKEISRIKAMMSKK